MIDIDVYTINGEDYYLLAEEVIKGVSYLYLSKVDDENVFMFRKRDIDDAEILLTLDNEEEVKYVALYFTNKLLGK